MNESLKASVLNIIKDKHMRSKGMCGTQIPYIINELKIGFGDLKEILNELYKDRKITIRNGLNGKIIFLKT